MSEPTFVLVHGAWGGAWNWRYVGAELDARGLSWVAVELPSSTRGAKSDTYISDDAQTVVAAAKDQDSAVLVGHSYGGAVITEAASATPTLTRLVYVAALVPELGKSASDTNRVVNVRTTLDDAIEFEGEHLRLNRDLARAALYQDCPDDIAEWALGQLSTQTLASFLSPRTSPAVNVPTHYIVCSEDNAIDPSVQEVMASRCQKVDRMVSGHSPMFSQPKALCDQIIQGLD